MNLTEANLRGPTEEPDWFVLYWARAEYNLLDLSPKSLDDFFQRLVANEDLFQQYYEYNHTFARCFIKVDFNLCHRNYNKASDVALAKECDETCRGDLLCRIVTTNYADQSRCESISN